ncbi:MAG: hypothetical protein V4543_06060 [Bacteroidota bacterium]
MKPVYILLGLTALAFGALLLYGTGNADYKLAMRIGMSGMLLFTAIGHFAFTKGMEMMLPTFIPFKRWLVYFTGLIEIAAAVGLVLPAYQRETSLWLIVFFVSILPANISAAMNRVDYESGTFKGPGTGYLWFRVPAQIGFIAWVWCCGLM